MFNNPDFDYRPISTLDRQVIDLHIRGNPQSLITTRHHGNELSAGEAVDAVLSGRTSTNPGDVGSLLYIPNAHPNAIKINQRRSETGTDGNRIFFNPYLEKRPERINPLALTLMGIANHYSSGLRTAWLFHGNVKEGDIEAQPFHLYSCTPTEYQPTEPKFMELFNNLVQLIELDDSFKGPFDSHVYTGQDTPDLDYYVSRGIVHQQGNKRKDIDHTYEMFLTGSSIRSNGNIPPLHIDRAVVFEIPGVLHLDVQTKMVELIFKQLIIPYTRYVNSISGNVTIPNSSPPPQTLFLQT